ncbi:hypothetical protein ACJX0J_042044, partial [Zea mays]
PLSLRDEAPAFNDEYMKNAVCRDPSMIVVEREGDPDCSFIGQEQSLTTIFAAHPQETTSSFWHFLLYIDNSDPKKLVKRLGKRLKTKESLLDPKMREATEAAQKLLHNLAVAQLGAMECQQNLMHAFLQQIGDQRKQPFLLTGIKSSLLTSGCDMIESGQGYATDLWLVFNLWL